MARPQEHDAEPERMMNMKQLTAALGCGQTLAYQIANQPDFPKLKVNSHIMIPISAFNRWVKMYTGKQFNT